MLKLGLIILLSFANCNGSQCDADQTKFIRDFLESKDLKFIEKVSEISPGLIANGLESELQDKDYYPNAVKMYIAINIYMLNLLSTFIIDLISNYHFDNYRLIKSHTKSFIICIDLNNLLV